MMDLFRRSSTKRRRRKDSEASTTAPRLRSSASLPDLKDASQPFFIPDEAFDLAQLQASAKPGPLTKERSQPERLQQPRHTSAPLTRAVQPDSSDPFERIRPVSSTSRRSSTFSNTTTGPTPDFFSHQKSRRSFSSIRTTGSIYQLSEAHKQEMNKLRKASTVKKHVEPLEDDASYGLGSGQPIYHPLTVEDISLDFETDSAGAPGQALRKPAILKPVFRRGYDIARDFRASPSANGLAEAGETKEEQMGGSQTQDNSPMSDSSHISPISGPVSSVLNRPRKSMIFRRPDSTLGLVLTSPEASSPSGSWGKESSKPVSLIKGRKGRDVYGLNLVVVGSKGLGKTSLSRMLLALHKHPGFREHLPDLVVAEEVSESQAYSDGSNFVALSSPLISTRSFRQDAVLLTVDSTASPPPTSSSKRFSRHPGKPIQSLHPLTIIDTPGLPVSSSTERQLAVTGLERLLEGRMADKLNLELQVERSARRSGKEEDGLIHLVLYLIDPVSILSNAGATASSSDVFEFVDEPASNGVDAWKPQLRQEDVAAISRLSSRTTVLPVIARADTLSVAERATTEQAVRRDLLAAGLHDNLAVFDNFARPIPTSPRGMKHCPTGLKSGGSPEQDPMNATKLEAGGVSLPAAIPAFCFNGEVGEHRALPSASRLDHIRRYPWGELDVLDARFADTVMLYSFLLSKDFVSALIERTKEELYEDYRTERLAVL